VAILSVLALLGPGSGERAPAEDHDYALGVNNDSEAVPHLRHEAGDRATF
jgi:hypothetical protein